MPENAPEKVIIIGSGPAGWTAAIYAARANLHPLVFPGRATKGQFIPGGQLMATTDVENYPGFPDAVTGPELMQRFFDQAIGFGTRVVTDDGIKSSGQLTAGLFTPMPNVEKVDLSQRPFRVSADNGFETTAHSLIIATGAKANWLNLENEQRLAQTGGGVSACAVCDGALPMFREQELGVVGGGDSAVEEATYLTKFASKVHVFVRRGELRASKIMADRLMKDPKVKVHWHTQVVDVLGDDKITGVRLLDNQTDEQRDLPLSGLFLAIGHTPATEFLQGQLDLDSKGYVVLEDPYRSTTNVEGVFVAGDVSDHVYRQAITAAGMGCKAAIDAERWLAEQHESDASDDGLSPEAHWEMGDIYEEEAAASTA